MARPSQPCPSPRGGTSLSWLRDQRPSGAASGDRLGDPLDLVVLLVGVDLIEVVVLAQDVLGRQQPGLDRVVGVVVAERAVATDDLQVLELVDERP